MIARLLLTCLGSLAAATALAQAEKIPVAPARSAAAASVAMLPQDLGGLRRSGDVTDFEARPGGAGLGASVAYRPAGEREPLASVYLYDRGRRDLDGTALHPAVVEELRTAAAELDTVMRMGRYRAVQNTARGELLGTPGRPALVCDRYRLELDTGAQPDSLVCVGLARGAFLKLRFTGPQGSTALDAQAPAGRFARAMVAAVGG